MLQVAQGSLDATEDPGHGAARVAHVISLYITGFAFSQIGLELEKLVQLKAWVGVDGVFGRTVRSICVNGLIGTASYDKN